VRESSPRRIAAPDRAISALAPSNGRQCGDAARWGARQVEATARAAHRALVPSCGRAAEPHARNLRGVGAGCRRAVAAGSRPELGRSSSPGYLLRGGRKCPRAARAALALAPRPVAFASWTSSVPPKRS